MLKILSKEYISVKTFNLGRFTNVCTNIFLLIIKFKIKSFVDLIVLKGDVIFVDGVPFFQDNLIVPEIW